MEKSNLHDKLVETTLSQLQDSDYVNAAKCTNCGEVKISVARWHWTCCSCFGRTDGKTGIFLDGGFAYQRCGGNFEHLVLLKTKKEYVDAKLEN